MPVSRRSAGGPLRAPRTTRNARHPRRPRPMRPESARPRRSRRRAASGFVSRGRSRRGRESPAARPRAPEARRRSTAPSRADARSRCAARASAARVSGSAKYAGQTRRIPSSASSLSALPAMLSSSISRARSRTYSGVRRKISSSNSGQRPSPTEPSGSTASTPRSLSGMASATWRARCPPHEWPTTYAVCQPSASSTRPGVPDVRRHRVRPFHRRRLEPALLVPRDVVLLRELVGEIAQIVEAEPRSTVQQQHRRSAAGASPGDQRPVVVCRELSPDWFVNHPVCAPGASSRPLL